MLSKLLFHSFPLPMAMLLRVLRAPHSLLNTVWLQVPTCCSFSVFKLLGGTFQNKAFWLTLLFPFGKERGCQWGEGEKLRAGSFETYLRGSVQPHAFSISFSFLRPRPMVVDFLLASGSQDAGPAVDSLFLAATEATAFKQPVLMEHLPCHGPGYLGSRPE